MIETCADFHFVTPVMILTLLNHTNCNFKRIKTILHREEALFETHIYTICIKFWCCFFLSLSHEHACSHCCCCFCDSHKVVPPIVPPDFFDYISIELNVRTIFGAMFPRIKFIRRFLFFFVLFLVVLYDNHDNKGNKFPKIWRHEFIT